MKHIKYVIEILFLLVALDVFQCNMLLGPM